MVARLLIVICAALVCYGQKGSISTWKIRGVAVDSVGAAVGGASVQLLDANFKLVAHVTADVAGKFSIETVDSGNFVLKVWLQGFRSRRLPVATDTEITDVGKIHLDVADCDAPGVICDWFGETPPHDPVASRGYLQVQTGCMLTFARSKGLCPGDPTGTRESEADVRITVDENGVYLTAMNGAALSKPNLPRGDCHGANPRETKVRIDGLGPGDDICLHTHDRHW
jgi:hypothetical protein